ncbi:MAG: response regulator [Planctomycetota bacterium]
MTSEHDRISDAAERFLRQDLEQQAEPKGASEPKPACNPSADTRSSVLVIDSDPLMLTAMGSVLDMQGHRAVMARNEQMAMESIQAGEFDVIVLAIESCENGCEFAGKLRGFENTRDVPILFLIPETAKDWDKALAEQGGVYSMQQPIEPEALTELVERMLVLPHVARSHDGLKPTHLPRQTDWVKL